MPPGPGVPETKPVPVELEGQIERITYTNDETGYTVAQVTIADGSRTVSVVGNILSPIPGEVLVMRGEWEQHPRFGRQFKLESHRTRVPATATGIKKYLGSGLVRGIGPTMAERIVDRFGSKTLDVIENQTQKLAQVEGIGAKRIERIKAAWNRQKRIRDVMIFLHGHGVGTGYAARIFKRYGQRSIAVVQQNPYRLATDISGIGFSTADRIAARLEISRHAPQRIMAGILHQLQAVSSEGHLFYPYEQLIEAAIELLGVDREQVRDGIAELFAAKRIVIEDLDDGVEVPRPNHKAVYLPRFFRFETGIVQQFERLLNAPRSLGVVDPVAAATRAQKAMAIRLARRQKEAIAVAAREKFLIITGGPGTGKTTLIRAVIQLFSAATRRVVLAAPTGRAAKRLGEATRREAMTIHRLLEYNFRQGGFQRNENNPIPCDLLIVDEASMIDTALAYHLLRALPDGATLIWVGDVHQLPSVGPGNVLKDLISSTCFPVVELDEIFRQAKTSRIVVNAHRINRGRIPELENPQRGEPKTDFYFFEQDDPEKVLELILTLACERIPRGFNFDPLEEIQVLTPMHKGIVGAENLNRALQERLNPGPPGGQRGETSFRPGDKVMQIRNNYDKDVFNGDIGRVRRIDPGLREMTVSYDGRPVGYEFSELDEVVPAYAISVHKSQGSEYPVVILPVLTQHYVLLQRNLIYTAVTRARSLVAMVGTRKALAIGIRNDRPQQRYTLLEKRIQEIVQTNRA
jgi:exodeoxyribonuclease V alpha subunit